VPFMQRKGGGGQAGRPFYIIWDGYDGQDGRRLRTLRIYQWNNASVYFDGWDFIILEEKIEEE